MEKTVTETVQSSHHGKMAWRLSASAVALIAAPGLASAGSFTPPTGVSAYRLLFTSADPIAATSADIATYNNFATSEAAQNATLPSATWRAIISTTSVNAITNASCGTSCDANVPIYAVDGTLMANSLNALFAGDFVSTTSTDQSGIVWAAYATYAWTGSNVNGTAAPGFEAGNVSTFTNVGMPSIEASAFMYVTNGYNPDALPGYGIYALSSEIDVPEPASGAALLLGGLAVTSVFRRRRVH